MKIILLPDIFFGTSVIKILVKIFTSISLIFAISFQNPISAQSNEGTDFWFSFMEHRNPGQNTMVVMITSRVNTTGNIDAPLAGYSFEFTVKANDVTIVNLPDFAETIGSESIDNNGFKVTSRDPVSVYIHQYHQYRAEATVVLPVGTIGKEYYALSYEGYFTEGQLFPSQMLLVANEDNTKISIKLSANTKGGRLVDSTFIIDLDAGETYQIQGASEADDLSGSYIQADKNFSLFCGNRYSALNCFRSGRDNLLEQAYPVSAWGTQFVTTPFQQNIPDIYRILASENNTQVNVYFNDGNEKSYAVDEGKFIEYEDERASYIKANKPILIAQYMNQLDCGNGRTGDPSMLYLNSIFQIRDTVTLYNSSFQNIEDNFINIIFQASDSTDIFFDGQNLVDIVPSFVLAGLNNEFASATIKVNTGSHTITSTSCGVIAKAYGLGDHESYAYSGGASFTKINASPIPDGGCLNDTIFFATELPEERYSVQWVFGPGDTVRDHEFIRIYNELGSYRTELHIYDMCFDKRDTLQKELLVTLRQSVEVEDLDDFCVGDDIQLSATDVNEAVYEWTGPNGYFSVHQFPVIASVKQEDSGMYEVIGIVSGCATFPAFVEVRVNPNPSPDLGPDAVFCPLASEETILNPGEFQSYIWFDGSSMPHYSVTGEGLVQVFVFDKFGCTSSDSIMIIQQCPTQIYVPNVFSPNGDQVNDEFGIFGTDIISLDLRIYDRWGTEVFHSTDQNDLWDGRYRLTKVDVGVYSWFLDLEGYEEDGSVFKRKSSGSVTLIR